MSEIQNMVKKEGLFETRLAPIEILDLSHLERWEIQNMFMKEISIQPVETKIARRLKAELLR